MDIIPIIYTVLIIVIILTVFTLTYSFYSFNHKQKKHSTSTTDQSSKINESRKELIVEKKVLAIPAGFFTTENTERNEVIRERFFRKN